MSKRIISLLISLTLICGMIFSMPVLAEETTAADATEKSIEVDENVFDKTEEPVSDPESEKLEKSKAIYESMLEEVGLLKSLGIMNDANEENMNHEVTRAEFVRYMLQFLNVDAAGAADGVNTYYVDIPTDYAYYNDITTATALGLVNGGSGGVFNPNSTISYQDALKIVVSALDYGTLAAYRGGYPQGYIAIARDIKLTDDISIGFTENLTMKELVRILFNALNSSVSESVINTTNSVSISSGDELYIESRFDVVKYRGVVTGTSYTRRLEGKDDLYKMEIDGVEYNIGRFAEFNEEEVLGQRVYFYLQYPDDDVRDPELAEVIFVNPLEGHNKIVEIIDEDIEPSTNARVLEYYDEKDNVKSINISDAIVFYNGKIDNTVTNDDFKPERGSIRAIDNNRDGRYDYVFIKNSVQRVVDVAASETIKFKYGLGELEVPKHDSKILLYRYGAEITTDYLGEWEVLEVMLCKDGESGIIDVSKKVVEGAATTVRADEYVINGTTYELSQAYMDALESGHFQAVKPKKNDTCQFILDERGQVAAMTSTLTAITEYGFLVGVASEGGLDKTNQVKIYCQYGIMNIFPVDEKIKINGRRITEGEDIEHYFWNNANVFEAQLVRFTRNNGIVTQIETAVDTTGGRLQTPGLPEPDKFSMDYRDTTSWSYDNVSYMVEDTYIMLDATTPVFWVPFETNKDSLYHYYDSRDNLSGLLKTTDIYVYDSVILEDYVGVRKPGAIVLRTQAAESEITDTNPYTLESIASGATYYVVDTIEETGTASDGTPTYSLIAAGNITINFEEKVYNVDTANVYGQGNYSLGNLEKGDLIQVGYGNDSSKANRFLCIATANGNGITNEGYLEGDFRWWNNSRAIGDVDISTNAGTTDAFVIGEIVYIKNPYYVIRTKNAAGQDKVITLIYQSGMKAKMFEKESEKVWDASYWEFETGQRVLIRIVNSRINYAIMVSE